MIRRAWSATNPRGKWNDRFATALAAKALEAGEGDRPLGGSVQLVDGWLDLADRMYAAAGEPCDADAVDAAVEEAEVLDLYEVLVD